MKKCSKCGLEKSFADFNRNLANKDGYQYACKKCFSLQTKARRAARSLEQIAADKEKAQLSYELRKARSPEGVNDAARKWNRENPQSYLVIQRRAWLKKYGLDEEKYKKMLVDQNHQCAICQGVLDCGVPNSVHIDHDHFLGEIRGLLCLGCNTGIGKLKDCPELLRRAAEYIEQKTKHILENWKHHGDNI